jgi:ABC-type spermidine/putrescine transport system permease subunit II
LGCFHAIYSFLFGQIWSYSVEAVDVPFQNYPVVSMVGSIPDVIPAIAVAAAIVVAIRESKKGSQ